MSIPEGKLVTWITMNGSTRCTHVGRMTRVDGDLACVYEWTADGWLESHAKIPATMLNIVRKQFLVMLLDENRQQGCTCSPFRLLTGRHDVECVLHGVADG